MKNFVTYCRVSTRKQGCSGLGLEAQRKICADFVAANDGQNVREFVDVESGTHRDRQGLADAVAYCKANGCALVVAKLDRLARDVEFCFRVVNTGIEIHFCDMPQINTLLLGVFAAVAQYERELTSERTRRALSVKKANGEALGAACAAYRDAMAAKSADELEETNTRRGQTRTRRHLQSRDAVALLRILRRVFPTATEGEPTAWKWDEIRTAGYYKTAILDMMQDYHDMDDSGETFARWPFGESDGRKVQQLLSAKIHALKNSVLNQIV